MRTHDEYNRNIDKYKITILCAAGEHGPKCLGKVRPGQLLPLEPCQCRCHTQRRDNEDAAVRLATQASDPRNYANLRDYCLGFCECCNRPVYIPAFQAAVPDGYKGCMCEIPDLYTWAMSDADDEAQRVERERAAATQEYHPTHPTSFRLWKKRAKNL